MQIIIPLPLFGMIVKDLSTNTKALPFVFTYFNRSQAGSKVEPPELNIELFWLTTFKRCNKDLTLWHTNKHSYLKFLAHCLLTLC